MLAEQKTSFDTQLADQKTAFNLRIAELETNFSAQLDQVKEDLMKVFCCTMYVVLIDGRTPVQWTLSGRMWRKTLLDLSTLWKLRALDCAMATSSM